MEELLDAAHPFLARFSNLELALMLANVLLMLFSRPLLQHLSDRSDNSDSFRGKLHMFRAANLLVLSVVIFNSLILPIASHSWMTRLLAAVLVAFLAYLSAHVANYLIKRRFGRERIVNGESTWSETYNVRVLSLLSSMLLFVVALIAVVRILGLDSLLEAGGVIGFIGVLLALTQSSWAPDIISGLVILNSRLIEEGDVIEVSDGESVLGVIYKTKIFHTEVLNLVNNHRIMFSNAKLRGMTIHNLSKFASAKGLREALVFKIGYDFDEAAVNEMFDAAFERAKQKVGACVEFKYEPEVRVTDAGDYAVEWTVYYYTKDVRHLLRTRQMLRALIVKAAAERGMSLATPMMHDVIALPPEHDD